MGRPRVKICGHTTEEDLAVSVAAGADAVGVITDVPVESPRTVAPDRAAQLFASVPPFVTRVLVTMPETPAAALATLASVPADAIQIHASLSPSGIEAIRTETDATVIATIDSDESEAHAYAAAADAVLVDSLADDNAGGTGEVHDWTKTETLVETLSVPVLLAGGLTPANVVDAVQAVDPYGVDVASGVEVQPGKKAPTTVQQFITAVHTTHESTLTH